MLKSKKIPWGRHLSSAESTLRAWSSSNLCRRSAANSTPCKGALSVHHVTQLDCSAKLMFPHDSLNLLRGAPGLPKRICTWKHWGAHPFFFVVFYFTWAWTWTFSSASCTHLSPLASGKPSAQLTLASRSQRPTIAVRITLPYEILGKSCIQHCKHRHQPPLSVDLACFFVKYANCTLT